MSQELSLVDVLRILNKWKKHLLIAVIGSGVVASLFSLFVMKEYYYSWAVFYPINQMQHDRAVIFNTESAGGQVDYFGTKSDVNRLISIANSATLYEFIIDTFKLAEHYNINTNNKYYRTKVRKEFDANYKAIKNEREAVEISIYDTDPQLASAILKTIIRKVDEMNKLVVNDTKKRLYALLQAQLEEQQKKIELISDSLAKLASQYQIKVSTGADGTVIVTGNDQKAVQDFKTLMYKQENAVKELNNRTNILEQIQVTLKSNASSLFVVDEPFPADRKSKPVRWLVVTVTMLITGIVCLIAVLIIEQYKNILPRS
ncbi:MAG: hypothetical protein NZM35_08880 [Chitinophagales bacterium]|nr:hypothetical protein [Chitinophagales bacterium]MDW8418000.1 hypothetical protein [Chitinophagales bacterium]